MSKNIDHLEELLEKLTDMKGTLKEMKAKLPTYFDKNGAPNLKLFSKIMNTLGHIPFLNISSIYGIGCLISEKCFGGKIDDETIRSQSLQSIAFNPEFDRITTAHFKGLVDVVLTETGETAFLIAKSDGTFFISQFLIDANSGKKKLLVPPSKAQLIWSIPRFEKIMEYIKADNDEKLFADIVTYIKRNVDLSENEIKLFSSFIMHTYCLEKFEKTPYIVMVSPPGCGKSTTTKAVQEVAYRGVHVSTLREAHLLRLADDYKASLFIDVTDIHGQAEKNNSTDVVLHRFERGVRVPRVLYPDRGAFNDTRYFEIFGATMVVSNEEPDPILLTRSIPIQIKKSNKIFEKGLNPEEALDLKERLTAFKARHYLKELPEVQKIELGRWGDITKPLLQIARLIGSDIENDIRTCLNGIYEDKKISDLESIEYQILSAMMHLRDIATGDEKLFIPQSHIVERVNENRGEYKYSSARVGRTIKSLGIKTVRKNGNVAHVQWDANLMHSIGNHYGLFILPEIPPFNLKRS